MENSFIYLIEYSIKSHWDLVALCDYKGVTYTYRDVARKIEKLHLFFNACGIQKGEKIALCSRNSANWGIAFLATLTYGAVAIPILHEFKADNIHHIINHSEARLLFVGDSNWEQLDHQHMPHLDGVIRMEDYVVKEISKPVIRDARKQVNRLFGEKFPDRFTVDDVSYRKDQPEEIAMINYTSGTTSASKGVVLPYLSMWSNLRFALDQMGYHPGEKLVAILTMAHMYGLAFEFIYPFASGTQVYFLAKTPSPRVIAEVFQNIRPNLIVAVPLIIEKVIRKGVLPHLQKRHIRLFMRIPILNNKVKASIKQKVLDAFGGQFKLLAVGGAALNHEVEAFLADIRFPYTVGYGMTECGPLISYDHNYEYVPGSCGQVLKGIMEVRIDSDDPYNKVGEIQVRGENVMKGYYKNEEATKNAFTEDGWLHTGDLGTIDADNRIFIRGRSKTMILGASGQNIYPEEIESKINNLPFVMESIVIEKNGKLVALVYPDYDTVDGTGISHTDLPVIMEQNRVELNKQLASYEVVSEIQLYPTEFEKTPKKSIKRYLYSNY